MIPLPDPTGKTDRERGYAVRGYTAQQMLDYGAECVAAERTLTQVDAAREVLTLLGYAISPSSEPGADDRVDRVASVLARCLQPNVLVSGTRRGSAAPDVRQHPAHVDKQPRNDYVPRR